MPKKATIRFDTDEISDISEQIIEVNNDFYTKRTNNMAGSLRFPIPAPIKAELNLKAGDICYFCIYSEGFYISFNHKPEAATKAQIKARKLAAAGMYDTLYLAIPPMIKNLYQKPIQNVKLIRTKGFKPYEWQIQFLFIDSI